MVYEWYYSWWIFPFLCMGVMIVFMLLMGSRGCFGMMHRHAEQGNVGLDLKTKELVAIGASIAANCQPCLKYHLKIAEDSGATGKEIKEAIETANAVKIKSATIMDKFSGEIPNGDQKSPEECCPEKKDSKSNEECCG